MPLRSSLLLTLFLGAGCGAPPAAPPPNEIPLADAGSDRSVELRQEVSLDGSRSTDPEGAELTFAWSASPANPAPLIFPKTQASFSFVPTVSGIYWFILTVDDGEVSSPPDSVKITVSSDSNRPPVADAGPDLIIAADAVIPLSAINSHDPDGDLLSYLWQIVQSPGPVEIADSSAQQTTVQLSASGDYSFRLTVDDGRTSSNDDVIITISSSANLSPTAAAGPDQQVAVGTLVTLDGSASADPEGDKLTFRWTLGRTPGSVVELSDSTLVQPTFTPPETGEYVFGLTVSDSVNASIQDVVTILVLNEIFTEQEGMIEIPTGPFNMGSDQGAGDERPVHRVELSTFWIDKFEVTAAAFQACVDGGFCDPAGTAAGCNAARSDRPDHPINCVNWEQAQNFCTWADKLLPTEAEWEKAARGLDARRFVWGDRFPHPDLLNYGKSEIDSTTPVGTYPAGLSFYGVHNMGGNVNEWTADYYDANYYVDSPELDPPGPANGSLRVVRGTNWKVGFPTEALTATVRQAFVPTTQDNSLGFRCARRQPPGE